MNSETPKLTDTPKTGFLRAALDRVGSLERADSDANCREAFQNIRNLELENARLMTRLEILAINLDGSISDLADVTAERDRMRNLLETVLDEYEGRMAPALANRIRAELGDLLARAALVQP